eukprot:Rmarinus@m.12527
MSPAIRWSSLVRYVESIGFEALKGLSSLNVRERILKPSDALFPNLNGSNFVVCGPIDVYVIHMLDAEFIPTFTLLRNALEDLELSSDPLVWFDVFCHEPHDQGNSEIVKLYDRMQSVNHAILVMPTWSSVLSQTSCIHELYCVAQSGAQFHVAMPRSERARLIDSPVPFLLQLLTLEISESSSRVEGNNYLKLLPDFSPEVAEERIVELLGCWLVEVGSPSSFSQRYSSSCKSLKKIHALIRLASFYRNRGNYKIAGALFRRCIDMSLESFGADAPITLQARFGAAVVHHLQGNAEAAISLYKSCIDQFPSSNDHAALIEIKTNYAVTLEAVGRHEDADLMLNDCVEACRKNLGPDHDKTLSLLQNLGSLHMRSNDYIKAEEWYEECLRLRQRRYGNLHPRTLVTMSSLASVSGYLGKYQQCSELYEVLLEDARSTFGQNHHHVLKWENDFKYFQSTPSQCFSSQNRRIFDGKLRVQVDGKWKKYFCVIRGGELQCFKQLKQPPKIRLPLLHCDVMQNQACGIFVIPASASDRPLSLMAKTPEQRASVINAIEKVRYREKLFDCSLDKIMSRPSEDKSVPKCFSILLDHIEQNGLETKGIYREEGASGVINDLQCLCNKGFVLLALEIKKFDVHAAACVVKRFIRSLEPPLVPEELLNIFGDAGINEEGFWSVYRGLPSENQCMLRALFRHLHLVTTSVATLMTVENVSRVIAPCLFIHALTREGLVASQAVVRWMLSNSKKL